MHHEHGFPFAYLIVAAVVAAVLFAWLRKGGGGKSPDHSDGRKAPIEPPKLHALQSAASAPAPDYGPAREMSGPLAGKSCELCKNALKKKGYLRAHAGGDAIVCPKCNSNLERKESQRAVEKAG